MHGVLISDGPFLADRIEIDDQNGVPGNNFPVKLDGTIVASGGYIVFIRADGNGETLHEMRRKVGVVR